MTDTYMIVLISSELGKHGFETFAITNWTYLMVLFHYSILSILYTNNWRTLAKYVFCSVVRWEKYHIIYKIPWKKSVFFLTTPEIILQAILLQPLKHMPPSRLLLYLSLAPFHWSGRRGQMTSYCRQRLHAPRKFCSLSAP